MIDLPDEEIKKYEGYVAKCEIFDTKNDAKLVINKYGVCKMKY
jgi:hypothetical protein